MTGAELRVKRLDAHVNTVVLGAAMGIHPSRISQIEALAKVNETMAARYLDSLASVRQSVRAAQ